MSWQENIVSFLDEYEEMARELTRTLYDAHGAKQEDYYMDALVVDAFQRGWDSLITTAWQMKDREAEE